MRSSKIKNRSEQDVYFIIMGCCFEGGRDAAGYSPFGSRLSKIRETHEETIIILHGCITKPESKRTPILPNLSC